MRIYSGWVVWIEAHTCESSDVTHKSLHTFVNLVDHIVPSRVTLETRFSVNELKSFIGTHHPREALPITCIHGY